MRILFAALAALMLLSNSLQAGTVNILPMSPKTGGTIKIEYRPSEIEAAWVEQVDELHAVVFAFSQEADAPVAYDVELLESSGRWTGTYTIPAEVVYGMVKVGDGVRYDNNKDLFWTFNVHDEGGRVLPGSYMKASMACLGMLPAECRRKQDYDEARDQLLEETKAHPRNIAASVNLVLLQVNTQEIGQEEAQARVREITGTIAQASSPLEAIALSQAYQMIGKPDEGLRIMKDAAQRFPNSKAAEQLRLEGLSDAPNIEVFVDKVLEHLRDFPTTFAKQNLIDVVINSSTRGGDLIPLVRFLNEAPALPAITYYQGVNYLGAQDTLRGEALRFISVGLAAAKDPSRRPSYVGPHEWEQQQRITTSLLLYVQGAIQRAQGKSDLALASFEESLKYGGRQTDKGTYEMYVLTLAATKQSARAIEVSEMAIKAGAATQGVMDTYRTLRRAEGKDSIRVENDLAELVKQGRSVLIERLGREMLNQVPIDGVFTTMEGQQKRISDWKGKVVILDYWATWCGPCIKSFPSLQKLYEKYRNNPNVVFAIVNVWERSDDREALIRGFLEKNPKLTFPILMDKDDSVVGRYGVTGIPTKFFIGKDGRIQFKEVGYLPDEQFIEEATNRIEVLLGQ